jgi:hypothetical protein
LEAAAGLDVTTPQRFQPSELPEKAPKTAQTPPPVSGKSLSPEEERAREEKEYQQKLIDVNQRLKNAQDRYSQAIRGTTSSEPSLLTTEEQLKARTDDIISRSLDAQYNPTEPAGTRLVTPSPFSSLPPTVTEVSPPSVPRVTGPLPPYTERQKELSELRSQTLQLEKDRERLIEEMKQKNFDSAKLLEQ